MKELRAAALAANQEVKAELASLEEPSLSRVVLCV